MQFQKNLVDPVGLFILSSLGGGCVGLAGETVVFSIAILIIDLCGQVFKGTRWMPWHQEPKKDVGICDKPGGVDNRALIPGCPNGETPPGARVTG